MYRDDFSCTTGCHGPLFADRDHAALGGRQSAAGEKRGPMTDAHRDDGRYFHFTKIAPRALSGPVAMVDAHPDEPRAWKAG